MGQSSHDIVQHHCKVKETFGTSSLARQGYDDIVAEIMSSRPFEKDIRVHCSLPGFRFGQFCYSTLVISLAHSNLNFDHFACLQLSCLWTPVFFSSITLILLNTTVTLLTFAAYMAKSKTASLEDGKEIGLEVLGSCLSRLMVSWPPRHSSISIVF